MDWRITMVSLGWRSQNYGRRSLRPVKHQPGPSAMAVVRRRIDLSGQRSEARARQTHANGVCTGFSRQRGEAGAQWSNRNETAEGALRWSEARMSSDKRSDMN